MKFSFLFAFSLMVLQSFCQTDTATFNQKDKYLKTSKTLKTVGWVFLGGGVVGIIVATNIANHSSKKPDEKAVAVMGLGFASCLISIPFFISGNRVARKAARLSFNNQHILLPNAGSFVFATQPTITLKIYGWHNKLLRPKVL